MFQSPSRWGRCCIALALLDALDFLVFQSPSRWGRCCIVRFTDQGAVLTIVSVPFTMGTVLHPPCPLVLIRLPPVSVPFSMGTVLHRQNQLLHITYSLVSVPFSMGTVLHRGSGSPTIGLIARFSPLLDGDGVASRT